MKLTLEVDPTEVTTILEHKANQDALRAKVARDRQEQFVDMLKPALSQAISQLLTTFGGPKPDINVGNDDVDSDDRDPPTH